MPTRRIVVTGTVQGVGFRYFVLRKAEGLGIIGEVWNRGDGAVELVGHHEDAARLAQLEQAMWVGPGFVSTVKGEEVEDMFGYSGFSIVRTRPV